MKERLVRGTNLRNVVRALRAYQKLHPLPEMGLWEQEFLRKRISASTWYSLSVFENLLAVVHRYVFDGSEAAALAMGRSFAREMIQEEPSHFKASSPTEELSNIQARWRAHFNFGDISVTPLPREGGRTGLRLKLTGYPDMSATHGQTFVGWACEVAAHAGARELDAHIEERPWMHNSALTFTLTWVEDR